MSITQLLIFLTIFTLSAVCADQKNATENINSYQNSINESIVIENTKSVIKITGKNEDEDSDYYYMKLYYVLGGVTFLMILEAIFAYCDIRKFKQIKMPEEARNIRINENAI